MENQKSVFATLNAINCNEHTEKKNGLTYLSWAWAWQMVKQNYPNAFYTIYETENGIPYFSDGRTCWVKTGVTIEGIEHIEYLPIMDYSNKSIPIEKVSSMDMNKAIQRSLTKACARHGLGLYIYAGEDLPDNETAEVKEPAPAKPKRAVKSGASSEQVGNKPEQAEQKDGIFDSPELQDAIEAAKNAKTAEELTQVWKDWRPKFGTFHEFVNAVKSNPNHPSHKQ